MLLAFLLVTPTTPYIPESTLLITLEVSNTFLTRNNIFIFFFVAMLQASKSRFAIMTLLFEVE